MLTMYSPLSGLKHVSYASTHSEATKDLIRYLTYSFNNGEWIDSVLKWWETEYTHTFDIEEMHWEWTYHQRRS